MKVDAQSILSLASYAIRRRKPTVSDTIPTVDDLRAEVKKLHGSELAIVEEGSVMPISSEKATAVATGCLPCSIGHLGTCSGLLNEAMRFARKDGIQSEEVIERVNMCMDELNSLERVDLRPEMIVNLPAWEKNLAGKALNLSRTLRHDLEQLSDVSMLEKVSAETQATRQEIGKRWFQGRLSRMTPEQQKLIEPALTLQEAKKVAAEEAAKEVEAKWHSQEKK